MAGERQARLADRIRVILAERLEKGLRDPRLGFVTITDVRVTGDLQHASVFYTVLGTDGFGFSDTRAAARRVFNVDAQSIVVAVLSLVDLGVLRADRH